MLVIGVVLLAAGGGLLLGSMLARKKLAVLAGVDRRKAGELQEVAKSVGGEIGGGSFREMVELVGEITCAEPLESPLGKRACVAYRTSVSREYEEEYEETSSNGNRERRTRRGSEVVSSNEEEREFFLKDESGQVAVVPAGATFEPLVESVSRFEPAPAGGGSSISFGGFSFALGTTAGRRTLGFRYEERIMPVAVRVTIVGQVSDADGRLAVRKGGEQFIVTTRTKEEMVAAVKKRAALLLYCGVGGLVAGAGLAIAGLVAP